jgi:spore coat protein U-like protein
MRRPWATLLLLLALAPPAEAANCTVAVTPVTFGTYNVFTTAPLDATGTVVYRCNGGAKNVWITISRGLSGTFAPRQMTSLLDRLSYNLFRDAARTSVWGDLSNGSSGLVDPNPPNNREVEVPIFGRIPPGQDVRAGGYADVVTVTVNY